MNFNDFVTLFFNNYFNIFLIIVILILLIIIAYLIKLQKSIKEEYSNLIIKNVKDEEKENEKNIIDESIISLESNEENTIDSIIKIEDLEEESKNFNIIENIDEEEENAIISTKELKEISEENKEIYGELSNAEVIEQYEQEQELKAIISYEELLKNASTLELKYEEKEDVKEGSPIIKKVEVETNPYKGVSYYAEEEYLKILKDFKVSLLK